MTDLTDFERETLAQAVRSVAVGPFGPNALDIIHRGGQIHLNGNEADAMAVAVEPIVTAHVEAAVAAALAPIEAPVRAAIAHVIRDHDKPPNKDRRGYDYRMGWWDAVAQLDRIVNRGVRICDDCPGPAALAGGGDRG